MSALVQKKPRRFSWRNVLLSLVCVGLILAGLFVYNPFWIVNRSTDLYLRIAGVKQRDVTVDGNHIHYLEAGGQTGQDKPLLLIHGLGGRGTNWVTMIPQLVHSGFHVYAIDLLGYGASDKPMDGDFTLSGEERTVLGMMDALHIAQPDVAGWSMGGWIATKLALDHPDRVRRLLLYDSAGMYVQMDFPTTLFTPTDRAGLEQLVAMIEPNQQSLRVPGIAVSGMLRRFRESRHIVEGSLSSMFNGREILDFRVRGLKLPVLMVWGAEDKLTPMSSGLRMHELVPQSVFVGIAGCGHLAAAECSSQVLGPTIEFLQADPPLPGSTTMLPLKK